MTTVELQHAVADYLEFRKQELTKAQQKAFNAVLLVLDDDEVYEDEWEFTFGDELVNNIQHDLSAILHAAVDEEVSNEQLERIMGMSRKK